MIDELFGKEETNIDVLGWLVRKPEAYLFETMANNYIPGGICFGWRSPRPRCSTPPPG